MKGKGERGKDSLVGMWQEVAGGQQYCEKDHITCSEFLEMSNNT